MVEKIPVRDLPLKKAFGYQTVSDFIRIKAVAVDRGEGAHKKQKDQYGKDNDRRK